MDKISVLIPTYNVEKYITEAVNSIVNQSFSNLEIVIVDDCSTDNTYELLSRLKEEEPRIKLYRNAKNFGIAETLNFAFNQSSGAYIARMDGDDISKPNRIQILYNFLNKNPEIDLVGSQTETINEKGDFVGFSHFPTIEQLVYSGLKYRMSTVAHIWLARRNVYDKLGKYRIPPVEDYDFLLRMRTSGLRFLNLDQYLYKVRIREGNTGTTQGLRQRLAADFVYKLYKERLKFGYEKTDYLNYVKASTPLFVSNKLFHLSNKCLARAVQSKNNRILFLLLLFLSIVLSPFQQTKFLIYRIKYKKLL